MGVAVFIAARDRLLEAQRSTMTSTEVCAEIERSVRSVLAHDAAAVMTATWP